MKVCKKVRLLTKDKKGFKKDGQKEILRERIIVSDQEIKESEVTCIESSILYLVDEEATKQRYEEISKTSKKPQVGRPKKQNND